jgi:hypothetical protein
VPPGVVYEDEAGRLWDVLYLLRVATGSSAGAAEVRFAVHVRNDNREGTLPRVRLRAVCGPGDDGEPVITVILPLRTEPSGDGGEDIAGRFGPEASALRRVVEDAGVP